VKRRCSPTGQRSQHAGDALREVSAEAAAHARVELVGDEPARGGASEQLLA